jgi:uncharacterized protein (TIGR03000 family)
MVRKWFVRTAMVAVVVLLVATDATQGQERRQRRGFFGRRGNTGGYVYGGNGYYGGPMIYQGPGQYALGNVPDNAGVRQASYYSPDTLAQENRVLIEVRLPAPTAEIAFDGSKTVQTGTLRQFISPPITAGQPYSYQVTARWTDNGKEVTRNRKIEFRAGQRVTVDLTRSSPDDRQND